MAAFERNTTLAMVLILIVGVSSCVHDPLSSDDESQQMHQADTIACDPALVNFSKDILPLLESNCALSGCHDQVTRADDIEMTSYVKVVQSQIINVMNAFESDLYEVLVETDAEKRMPPLPAAAMQSDQIALVKRWIDEGATYQVCADTIEDSCVTMNMTFTNHVAPIIDQSCRSCHSGVSPAGGIDLSTHAGVQVVALNGRLIGSIDHRNGFVAMPQGGDKLDTCVINQIDAWIKDGALNN